VSTGLDDGLQAGSWLDKALSGVDPTKAAKYREKVSYLDRALEGVPEEVKINVLRVMVNTDLRPDDPANILAILYGHIRAIGETIPTEMREASSDFRNLLADFTQETQIFPEVVAQVHQRVAAEVTEQALQLGKAGVQAAAVEELERMRIRLTSTSEEMLKQFLENAIKEKSAHSTDVLVVKNRTISAVAAVIVLGLGFITGGVWGSYHPNFTGDQQTQMRYGREFIRMYPSMPESMTSWVKTWVKGHPGQ